MAQTFDVDYVVDVLIKHSALTLEQAQRVRHQQRPIAATLEREIEKRFGTRTAGRFVVSPVEIVEHMEFVTPTGQVLNEDLIMTYIAADVGMVFEKPDVLKLSMDIVTSNVNRAYARHNDCVPLRRENGRMVFALHNPMNQRLRQELMLRFNQDVDFVLSGKRDIQRIVTEFFGFRSSINAAQKEHSSSSTSINNLEQLTQLRSVEGLEATDQPVINAVEYLLNYAFEQRASDIHIEPKRQETIVRLRIDGVLHVVHRLPKSIHPPLISRLKMLARMDIAEKRRPQDGRIKTSRDGKEVELRVSSLPVAFGEKIVVRVFDPEALIQDLDKVGFYPDELAKWREFIRKPTGMIVVTGPTGSGKTTTLYSTLKALASPEVNITTVEDPIEMVHEDFNQVLVQRRIDVTFAQALRTILRQDPDIVMIGEIRDAETARMATQAALTGHLVFSTLHTNDTASTVTRLLDLGVEPFLLSSTLIGVMAQRLLRRICTSCKTERPLTREEIDVLRIPVPAGSGQSLPVAFGKGCVRCRDTGYFGRTGVFELMAVDDSIRKLIMERSGATDIKRAAMANNMVTLTECGIKKMAQGVTTFEEVVKVMSEFG